ncbi:MAG: hypothetical protein P8Z79_06135 [Sedimentisphaerales bacterium]|jgi:hypothetical protein
MKRRSKIAPKCRVLFGMLALVAIIGLGTATYADSNEQGSNRLSLFDPFRLIRTTYVTESGPSEPWVVPTVADKRSLPDVSERSRHSGGQEKGKPDDIPGKPDVPGTPSSVPGRRPVIPPRPRPRSPIRPHWDS